MVRDLIPFRRAEAFMGTMMIQLAHGTERRVRRGCSNDSAAHTISQRLRTLKRIPPELIPLGIPAFYLAEFDLALTYYRNRCGNCCRIRWLLDGPQVGC